MPGNDRVFARGMSLIVRAAKAHPLPLAISITAAVLMALMVVVGTIVLGRVTDDIIVPAFAEGVEDSKTAAAVAVIMAVAVFRAGGIVVRRYFAAMTSTRMQVTLRTDVTDRYLDTTLDWLRARPAGQLLAHADSDVEVTTEVLNPLPFAVGVITLVVVALVSLIVVDPVLTVVALLLFPALAVLNRIYTLRVVKPAALAQQHIGEIAAVAHESVDGVLVVKTLGREAAEVDRLAEGADDLRTQRLEVARLRAMFEPTLDALPNLGIIGLLALGSWRMSTGDISAGDLVQAMALFQVLAFPMRVIGYFFEEMPRSVVAVERVDRVLAAPASPQPVAASDLPAGPLRVDVDNVGFSYADVEVLGSMTFSLDPGEVVAMVGSTGSGKSTMCDLLIRLADPDSGSVCIGSRDLRNVDPAELHRRVSMVFQETFLFADRLGENVTLGDRYTEEQLHDVARLARAHGFIASFPEGYDTPVGERGVTLSGGQRQRVAIARALLREPSLLILDDATSAVDPLIEAEILGGLRESLRTTTLIVAHRTSTIMLADRVLFLADGRIRATGRHTDLLAVPEYEALVRAYEQAALS